MCPLGRGGILATCSVTQPPGYLHFLFSLALGCLWDLELGVSWVWKEGPLTPC